jgi:hypothetical protein
VSVIPEELHMRDIDRRMRILDLPWMASTTLPTRERVCDRLGDVLLGADDVLDLLRTDDAASIRWIAPQIQRVFDEVNETMKKLCD